MLCLALSELCLFTQSDQIKCKIPINIDNLHQARLKEIEKIQDGNDARKFGYNFCLSRSGGSPTTTPCEGPSRDHTAMKTNSVIQLKSMRWYVIGSLPDISNKCNMDHEHHHIRHFIQGHFLLPSPFEVTTRVTTPTTPNVSMISLDRHQELVGRSHKNFSGLHKHMLSLTAGANCRRWRKRPPSPTWLLDPR